MQSSPLKRLLVSLALVSFTRADYYIDDQNFTSLLYSENPGGAKWGPFQEGGETLSITLSNGSMMTIDASQCFNYTYTYAACTLPADCQVQIPFTGSGITVYVLQAGAQGINASLAIDDGTPQYNVLPAPPGPNFYNPNVTLFSIQGVTTGNHTATMTVQNWDNIFSGMMFDYALINQTIVSPATTTSLASSTTASTSSSPTTTALSSSKSITHVGVIVGGVVGGLIVLISFLLAIFYLRRKRHRQAQRISVNLDDEPRLDPFLAEQLYRGPVQYNEVPQPLTTESGRTREKSRLGIPNPTATSSNINSYPWVSSSSAYSSEVSRPRIRQEQPMLSQDQADFVNNLYANNVPATVIARVIERMLAGERQPIVDGYDSLPPPSYYQNSGNA